MVGGRLSGSLPLRTSPVLPCEFAVVQGVAAASQGEGVLFPIGRCLSATHCLSQLFNADVCIPGSLSHSCLVTDADGFREHVCLEGNSDHPQAGTGALSAVVQQTSFLPDFL